MTSYCHIVTPVLIEDFMRKEAKKYSDEYTRVGYSEKRGDIGEKNVARGQQPQKQNSREWFATVNWFWGVSLLCVGENNGSASDNILTYITESYCIRVHYIKVQRWRQISRERNSKVDLPRALYPSSCLLGRVNQAQAGLFHFTCSVAIQKHFLYIEHAQKTHEKSRVRSTAYDHRNIFNMSARNH